MRCKFISGDKLFTLRWVVLIQIPSIILRYFFSMHANTYVSHKGF